MRNNEHGFSYPLTLCVVLLFLLIFSFRVDMLLSERKLAHETNTVLQVEYYFHSTIKKIEKTLSLNTAIPSKGTYFFSNGKVDYVAEKPIGTSQKVLFTLRLNTGETAIANGFFDVNTKRIIKWIEMN
nr:competence type IV pilus minor pilin ComGG [Neobacillus sp. Marseille-Q6967]